jgi:acyl-CoA oxidase
LPTLSYLSLLRDGGQDRTATPPVKTSRDWFREENQTWALEQRLSNLVQQHIEDTDADKDTSYATHALTMAHCDFVYFRQLLDIVQRLESENESYAPAMRATAQVFALATIQDPHHPSLAQAIPLSLEQHKLLREAYAEALDDYAKNHVASIIDAYGLTEYELDSALAKADQTPYEALLEGAKRSEMSGAGMSHLWPLMVDTRQIWKRIEEEKQCNKASKL